MLKRFNSSELHFHLSLGGHTQSLHIQKIREFLSYFTGLIRFLWKKLDIMVNKFVFVFESLIGKIMNSWKDDESCVLLMIWKLLSN